MNRYTELINILHEISQSLQELNNPSFFKFMKFIIPIVISIFTLITVIVIACQQHNLTKTIADNQSQLSEENIRLGLFNERIKIYYNVYNILFNFINSDLKEKEKVNNLLNNFEKDIRKSKFLFNNEIKNKLEQIYKDGIATINTLRELENKPILESKKYKFISTGNINTILKEKNRNLKNIEKDINIKIQEARNKSNDYLLKIDDLFFEYLDFSKYIKKKNV